MCESMPAGPKMSDTFCGSMVEVLWRGVFGDGISGAVWSLVRDRLEVSRIEGSSSMVLMSGWIVDIPTLDFSVERKK